MHKMTRISDLAKQKLASQERPCSRQLINYIVGPIYAKNFHFIPMFDLVYMYKQTRKLTRPKRLMGTPACAQ
jgi:hypothetical protein